MRVVGNRYSEEELVAIEKKDLAAKYSLDEQPDFKGTPEDLEYMQYAERRYFDGRNIMSDEEWDGLKKKFNYKETLESVAPSGRKFIKLLSPLVSLNKAGNNEELNEFLNKFDDNQEFQVEPKMDGICANVIFTLNHDTDCYEYDTMTSRSGEFALEFHKQAFYGVNFNFPKTFDKKYIGKDPETNDYPERIELRGEAVIPINPYTLKKYMIKDSEGKLVEPVWRNTTSGMTTRKVPQNIKGLFQLLEEENGQPFDQDENGDYILTPSAGKTYYTLIPYEDIMMEDGTKLTYRRIKKVKVSNDKEHVYFYNSSDELLRQLDAKDFEEYLDIVFYSMSVDGVNRDIPINIDEYGSFYKLLQDGLIKHISNIDFRFDKKESLDKLGCKKVYRITRDRQEIKQAILDFYGCEEHLDDQGNPVWVRNEELPRLRNMYKYALDGVVIKPTNSSRESQKLDRRIGRNGKIIMSHYPDDQIAVKLRSEIMTVKIDHFEYKKTKLGNVTISAILDKNYRSESGSFIGAVNCHNPEWLEKNSWIKEAQEKGQSLDLIMSLDIIPVFLKPEK